MIIPKSNAERLEFYLDLTEKCMVSRDDRMRDYGMLKNFFLFGSEPNDVPALFNKIAPHIDQLNSFLYSSETTRFSISIGASVPKFEHHKIPVLTRTLNDEWLNSNMDEVFSGSINWALVYNSTFVKLVPYKSGVRPYMVDPGNIGVLREDRPYLDKQEAFIEVYYMTKSELFNRLYSHPNRDALVKQMIFGPAVENNAPEAINRIITSSSAPNITGTVSIGLEGTNRYVPKVSEDLVLMRELYVWNDDESDYQVVTIAEPDVVIYDRGTRHTFLKGESPFVQICPNPLPDYFWGQSEVQKMIYLQMLRTKRLGEISTLLEKQVRPPKAFTGFMGITDEKAYAMNSPGGYVLSDMPGAKVDDLSPKVPEDLFKEIDQIDAMFAEVSGISSVLQGKGEKGVRSEGHASQLARLGASRAKKRALVIEDALERVATLFLKVMQVYDPTKYKDEQGKDFIAEQFTKDFVVKVDAHSNSPIFMEDSRDLAFKLYEAKAIDRQRLIDLVDPPMKQLLKDDLEKLQAKEDAAAAQQAQAQAAQGGAGQQPPKSAAPKPQLVK